MLNIELKKDTYKCAKNVVHTVHTLGTIFNDRNIKHVKNKKELLGKLNACKLGTILQC